MENEAMKAIKFSWWVGFISGLMTGIFLTLVLVKFN